MLLTLEKEYNIYNDYDEIEMIKKDKRVTFYFKGTNRRIGFEYPEKTEENKDTVKESGYIRIRNLFEKKLITQDKYDELMSKASHSSDKNKQKNSKGCISTYDLSEEELKELIELNIELLKTELRK